MKKWFSIFLVMMMSTVLLMGCSTEAPGSTDNAGAGDAKDGVKVGFSVSTQNNPFFVTLKDGATAQAEKDGVDLIVVDAQDDSAKQISDIEDLIQQGVDVIVVNPTDSAAVASAIESANSANIPVITVDRSADAGEIASHIASDNVAGGKMAGEYILELLGNKGKIVELEGIPGSSAARERGQGFHEAVDGVDGVEVVAKQAADFDRAKGLSVMENIIQGTPEINAVFAHNDEMALGALQALQAAGLNDVVVVGFDATADAVKSVEDGKMKATVAQKPSLMGEEAIKTAMKLVNGEQTEDFIPVDLELIKK